MSSSASDDAADRPAATPPRGHRSLWIIAILAVLGAIAAELTRPLAPAADAVALANFLPRDQLAGALAYREPLRVAAIVSMGLRVGTAAVLWWLAGRWDAGRTEGSGWRGRVVIGLLAAGVWAATDVIRLPLQLWAWSRAVDVGLSTQSLVGWLRDWSLTVGPQWIGVAVAVIVGVVLRERLGRRWVPATALLAGVAGVVLVVISPRIFEPLLFDFTPLEDGELLDGITELAERAPFDAEVLVADASRRTTAANAYVSGIAGTRRIVLYDTLIEDTPTPVILATVAHEIAHTEHRDVERTALSLFGICVVIIWALDRALGDRVIGTGGRVTRRGAVRAVTLIIIGAVVIAPLGQLSSRRTEAAADARALQTLGNAEVYREMLLTLATRNLSDPDPPAWIVGLAYSHPPMAHRVGRAAEATQEESSQ